MRSILFFILTFLVVGCGSYKENLMFTIPENFSNNLDAEIFKLETGYTIKPHDLLDIMVINKSGEILIDPEFQSQMDNGVRGQEKTITYRVTDDGTISMPMVGELSLKSLTIPEAEARIATAFEEKFDQPFVKVSFNNKRAFILGANGGQVIPLNQEGVTLIEAISLAGGIQTNGKANTIRLIRGNDVLVVDLSQLENIHLAYTPLRPMDIVYIEPIRRPLPESLREYSPIVGIVSAIASIAALILSLSK